MVPTNKTGDIHLSFDHPTDQLIFFALGDTGSGDKNQFDVADAMEKKCNEYGQIDGILLLGDNIYMSGAESVSDPQWMEKVVKPYDRPCLGKAKIYPVLGNHDYKGKPGVQIEYSKSNKQWVMPHRFYSLKFGSLLKIIAIDTGFPDFCLFSNICSIDFLLEEANDSSIKWKVVTAHHPLSSSSKHGYSHKGGVFGFLLRPMICGKVNSWLSGHAHHLEHRILDDCDTDLFVAGGGGGSLYKVREDNDGKSKFTAQSFGYLEVKVSPDKLNYKFIDQLGKEVY